MNIENLIKNAGSVYKFDDNRKISKPERGRKNLRRAATTDISKRLASNTEETERVKISQVSFTYCAYKDEKYFVPCFFLNLSIRTSKMMETNHVY